LAIFNTASLDQSNPRASIIAPIVMQREAKSYVFEKFSQGSLGWMNDRPLGLPVEN
jgi:hypothetical protein